MDEKTRQLVLLTGIMSILVSGLVMFVAVNSVSQNTSADNNKEVEVSDNSEQRQEIVSNESIESENNSEKEINSSEMNIIQQSVHGLGSLWGDMLEGWGAILSLTDSNSDS